MAIRVSSCVVYTVYVTFWRIRDGLAVTEAVTRNSCNSFRYSQAKVTFKGRLGLGHINQPRSVYDFI